MIRQDLSGENKPGVLCGHTPTHIVVTRLPCCCPEPDTPHHPRSSGARAPTAGSVGSMDVRDARGADRLRSFCPLCCSSRPIKTCSASATSAASA